MSEYVEVIEEVTVVETDDSHVDVIEVAVQGPAGPPGPQGPQGDPASNLVTSVNGQQDDVNLDAADVGADPIGSALQAYLDAQEHANQLAQGLTTALQAHASNTNSPHAVTKAQVGLGSVDNTADVDKPVSTAQQAALDSKTDFPASNQRVPVRGPSGEQTSLSYTSAASPSSVPFRTNAGTLKAATASATDDLVPKAQMDAATALKVDKVSLTNRVYGTDNSGAQTSYPVSQGAAADSVARRDGNGRMLVTDAVVATQVPTKGQIDAVAPIYGSGTPNGVVTATPGRIYADTAVTSGFTLYVKTVGTGNTGWVSIPTSGTIPNITASVTEPTAPNLGDIWVVL